MKRIKELSFTNLGHMASAKLINITMVIAGCAVYIDQILEMVHEFPIPISPNVDIWVRWIIKVAGTIMVIYTALSKKKDIDIGVKVKDVTPTEGSNEGHPGSITSMGKNSTGPAEVSTTRHISFPPTDNILRDLRKEQEEE